MIGHAAAAGLWVANADSNTLADFQGKLKSGSKAHRILNDGNDLDGPSTVAFDKAGNLWVTNFNANTITQFSASELHLLKKRVRAAAVTISEDSGNNLSGPEGLAFDSSGNMWVGAENGQVVLEYTPTQFAASGSPTPNIILNATFKFSSPSHVAFDGSGNLWVVDEGIANGNGGSGEVFKYTHAQIAGLTAGTIDLLPVFGISLNAFSHLEAITFDGSGNLWLADEGSNNVYEFTANQLTATGLATDLTPAVVLSASSRGGSCHLSLDGPYGVAVDASGNLFVSNANTAGRCLGSLAEFSAGSIASTGSPKPKAFITGSTLNSPNAITFGPSVP
jgi:sugar lactone lactonase YvrE